MRAIIFILIVSGIAIVPGCQQENEYQRLIQEIETEQSTAGYSDEAINKHANELITNSNVDLLVQIPFDKSIDLRTRILSVFYLFEVKSYEANRQKPDLLNDLLQEYSDNPDADNLRLAMACIDSCKRHDISSVADQLHAVAISVEVDSESDLLELTACEAWLAIVQPRVKQFREFASEVPDGMRRRALLNYAKENLGYQESNHDDWNHQFSLWLNEQEIQ